MSQLMKFHSDMSKDWEEDFDLNLTAYDKDGGFKAYNEEYGNPDYNMNQVKSYITSLLENQRDEICQMIEGMKVPANIDHSVAQSSYNAALNEIITKLKDGKV